MTLSDTTHDLYLRVAAKSRFPINRLRITKASDSTAVPNSKDVSIEEVGLFEQSTIFVKDLGPQIGWRTVFIIEYLGPLLIHPLIYLLRSFIYQNPNAPGAFPAPSFSQTLSMSMITLHFLKREIEGVYLHRFSASTMPLMNVFKNSAHYWLLAGANIALFTYSPQPECPTANPAPEWTTYAAFILYTVGELGNFSAHLTLRNLRSSGGTERGIPSGGVFDLIPVTCPNYFFEAMAWLGMWAANRSLSTLLFIVVAVAQMALWAKKKESRYRKEFGRSYKKKRFAMLPGII